MLYVSRFVPGNGDSLCPRDGSDRAMTGSLLEACPDRRHVA